MRLEDRKRRVPSTDGGPPAGQPAPPPVSAPLPPAPAVPVRPAASAPEAASAAAPRRGMTEDRARRIARDRNADRQPGDPIWVAWRLQQPDGKVWDVGTVPPFEPKRAELVRDWDKELDG